MAQDFAKRSARGKQPPPSRFSLGSFVAGVIAGVGLFLAGAYGPELLSARAERAVAATPEADPVSGPDNATDSATGSAPTQPGPGNAATEESPDLEFVFRDLLGEDQVNPDLSAYEADIQAGMPKRTSTTPMQYLLQSGSFQIRTDAETRRGQVLLLNLPATIVEARIDNKIWYRVIVGPYAQRGQAQQAASRLKASSISSMWLEQPLNESK